MATKKRYINAEYVNGRDKTKAAGHHVWLKATVKRGKRPQPPTVTWVAERSQNGDDDLYMVDPDFEVPAGQEEGDTRWACVTLPQVTGARWSFSVTRYKQGKANKTVQIPNEYETWKRYYLDVDADTKDLYELFTKALPKIQRAFAPACIEVVENRVKVSGKPKLFKKTDKSVNKEGRKRGDVFHVQLSAPQDQEICMHEYRFQVANGQATCSGVAAHNNSLTITLHNDATWDTTEWIRSLEVHSAGGELLNLNHWGGAGRCSQVSRADSTAAITTIATRTSATVVTINLNAAPMNNTWDPALRTWTAARQTTVAQAIAAGAVTFKLNVKYTLTGSTGGQQIGNQTNFQTWINEDENHLASTLSHEFGHACGLVSATSVRRYNEVRRRHTSSRAARIPMSQNVDNQRFYDASFGGLGTHCNLGAQTVGSCVTASGQTYQPQADQDLCLMYHASTVDDDGNVLTDNISFCDACIKQLRGR